jgi:hypothetical protein
MTAVASEFDVPPALLPMLDMAVPLRVHDLRYWSWAARRELASAAVDEIASRGDVLLFRGGRKGESARVFIALVDALAVLALQPGGVTFADRHWEGRPSAIAAGGPLTAAEKTA